MRQNLGISDVGMGQDLVPDKIYYPIGGMNHDSNGISVKENECIDAVNVVITQSEVYERTGSTLLGEGETQPTEDVIEYGKYVDPVLGTTLLAFCATTVWQYISGTGWEEIAFSNGHVFDVTQWSLTSGIDDNIGATLVAAGSTYTRPNDAQSGGSGRVLFYFLRGTPVLAGTMETLSQTSERPIEAEDTTYVGPVSASIVKSSDTSPYNGIGANVIGHINYDSNYESMEPGTFVIGASGSGILGAAGLVVYSLPVGLLVLGDASDGANVDCYRLTPTDGTLIKYGDTSYVRVDGKEWSLEFLTNDSSGDEIYIGYDYNASVNFYPTYVSFYHNSLIMSNTYEETVYIPWRARYTVQGDITKTFFRYYQDVAIHDISPIIQMKVMETVSSSLVTDYLYIYKQSSIIRAQYNQNFNISEDVIAPFMNFETAHTEGLEAVRTLVSAGGLQLYLGLNDVYMFDGTRRQSLTFDPNTGSSRVKNMIFENLDLLSLDKCFGIYDEINERYMLFIKTVENYETYPVDCFVYDMELQTWTRYTYPQVSAGINIDLAIDGAILDLKGNIEGLINDANNNTLRIQDLGGNFSKLVILAMTSKSYVTSGLSTQDKQEELGIKFFYDENFNAYNYMEPQPSEVNGKMWWRWESINPPAERMVKWDGSNWHAYSGGVLECIHPTNTDDRPPTTGWDEWEFLGTPNGVFVKLEYAPYGIPYDSYIMTRDFVGSSLHLQDRTSLVYVEGKRGEIDMSIDGNYGLDKSQFTQPQTLAFPGNYKRVNYSPDKTASWVRLLITLRNGVRLRWLQVFSTTQEFTNN